MIGISSKGNTRNWGDNTTNKDGTGSSYQHGKSYNYAALTYNQVRTQLIDTINNDPKWKASLEQEYNVNKILLDNVDNQIANTQNPLEKERLEIDKNLYLSNMTNNKGIITADYVDILFKNIQILLKTLPLVRVKLLKLI